MNDKNMTLRSPWSAYGPVIIAGIVLIVVIAVLFAVSQSETSKTTAVPVVKLTPDPVHDTTKRLAEARKRTGGDWNKATPEEKKYLDQISRGHGAGLLKAKQ
jgi:hypothetical protein